MKTSERFKQVIQAYLEQRAKEDELFAVNYRKENKNIDDCVTFILSEVQKSGVCGMEDDEVYSLAVHYYDEDDIKVGQRPQCHVVINQAVELTEEEKAEAHKQAIQQYQQEELRKLQAQNNRPKPAPKKTATDNQPSLFDMFGYETEN